MARGEASSGPRVLVTDAVPLNGGDEALLVGLLHALSARWPGVRCTVLCQRPVECRRVLPSVRIEPALPVAGGGESAALAHPGARFYREADLVLSAPGGFLSDHYDFTAALVGFEVANRLGKPLVLFAQSIGPFTNAASRRKINHGLSGAVRIAVRDEVSRRHLAECGVVGDRVVPVGDAAFLWRDIAPHLYVAKSGPPKRAGLCLRQWPHRDHESARETIVKARRLVEHLASRGIERFLFASTCQGVPGYVDDSELSVRVVAGLDASLQARCTVDRRRYHPEALIQLLAGCDVFVGMRLHACLLAMLGGTPAMGLAYEDKTPEIFRQLGCSRYQVPFTGYQTRWRACASRLLDDLDVVRDVLPAGLERMAARARRGLDLLEPFLTPAPVGRV